ncbi:MAG: Hpt domain-containing protein, partial [Methyloversatilis sp.]|nr:Hpt domain-containing protein [Methyloversatilis sp.]
VQGIGQTPHESLAPSADTVRLAEASQEDFDAELLEIFIEEAREVLDTMASSTDAARLQPHRQDLLTTLRRGFHTLKGSGRMVGLRDLGEAAFAVEQAMNRWLGSERDGTPELFDLLDGARMLFAGWVDRLAQGDTRSPEHEWLQPACDAIHTHDAEPAEGAASVAAVTGGDLDIDLDFNFNLEGDAPAAELVSANVFEPDTGLDSVTNIVALDAPLDAAAGDVDLELDFDLEAPGIELTLPESTIDITSDIDAEERALDAGADRTLFDLFLAEARGHVATLRRELTRLHINPSLRPSQDSLLAAHTLGGISLTVNQDDISALARALEHALLRCEARGDAPQADQSALLNSAASTLEAQIAAIEAGAIATPAPELIARLNALFGFSAVAPETVELQVLELPDMDITPVADVTDVLVEAPEPPQAEPFEMAGEPPAAMATEEDIVVADGPVVTTFEKVTLPDEYVLAEAAGNDALPFETARLPSARAAATAESAQASVVPDEIDHQLLPIFIEEAHDLLREIGSELRSWRDDTNALSASDALRRQLHTLKGSARMAGVMRFGDLVHSMETLIEQPCATEDRALLLDELDLGYDRCEELVAKLERGEALTPATEETATPTPAAEDDAGVPRDRPSVRVRSDKVDRFVNEAGEMSIARTRIEGELRSLRGSLNDLTENVQRLRSQLREIEIQAESQMQSRMAAAEAQHEQFDPLEMDRFTRFQELSRMMAESLSDVTTVQYNLVRNLDAADTAIQSQARLNRDLSQALMSVRMVPFSTLEDRLYRVARQSAKETGKKVNLELNNTRIELDREVLEKMTGPIEHLLRNAVAHGIEPR